jgi:hypothetical protein
VPGADQAEHLTLARVSPSGFARVAARGPTGTDRMPSRRIFCRVICAAAMRQAGEDLQGRAAPPPGRARVTGPAIAAVLAGTIGIGWCFVVNAVSFAFAIVATPVCRYAGHIAGSPSAGPVVRAVITMLCTWGCGRPCGPRWCSKEAATQRWGLTGENRLRPASCKKLSAA